MLTGMTKDGTFLIEDGRMTRPIRNLRFTQSIPEAFSGIAAIASDTRLVGGGVQRDLGARARAAHRRVQVHRRDRRRSAARDDGPAVDLRIGDRAFDCAAHPCGSRRGGSTRLGADIGLVCAGCGHRILMDRLDVERRFIDYRGAGTRAPADGAR